MSLHKSFLTTLVVSASTLLGASSVAQAATTNVAVAANFTAAAKEIAAAFSSASGHEAKLSFGATGQFYTQISQDAPFEVFLAADDKRPGMAAAAGLGVADSVFTYAIGQLVLYSATAQAQITGPQALQAQDVRHIAIANPDTAPYGLAAVQTLTALQLLPVLQDKLIQGQNIGQTFQFVKTGNAELGFVALGQVAQDTQGSYWVVPQELYQPIRQDAVLLNKGRDNPAAVAFMDFLKGDTAAQIIRKYGYALDH